MIITILWAIWVKEIILFLKVRNVNLVLELIEELFINIENVKIILIFQSCLTICMQIKVIMNKADLLLR